MSLISTLALTIGGWLAAHFLTLRAQRTQLRLKIMQEAGAEITAAIRGYQEWLQSAFRLGYRLLSVPATLRAGVVPDIRPIAADFMGVFSDRDRQRTWAMRLEEYEVLFPRLHDARVDLDRIHQAILKTMSAWHTDLLTLWIGPMTLPLVEALNARIASERALLDDQLGLLEDVRISVANTVLGPIAGHTIPPRVPLDPSVPRLGPAPNGQLSVRPAEYVTRVAS